MSDEKNVVLNVLGNVGGRVPATKLVKLVYLTDYIHFQHFGETITGLTYQWDHYGPNAIGHAIVTSAESLATEGEVTYSKTPNSFGGITKYFKASQGTIMPQLAERADMVVKDVCQRYKKFSVDAITRESKRTKPFKQANQYDLLKMEQSIPAMEGKAEDVLAYHQDIEGTGTLTLEQIERDFELE